jgi:alginate O-acetyltransferase complex protein AlgI
MENGLSKKFLNSKSSKKNSIKMFFNSVNFLIFFLLVFSVYWFLLKKNLKAQNVFLLISSYAFYAFWDYRFVFLLVFSTWLDYYTGVKVENSESKPQRKMWLFISFFINLGFLGFFKYYNFFIDSFSSVLSSLGVQPNIWTLKIILPVGISFYTFHGLSYVFDIYNKKIKATRDVVDYSLFVSFFPLLVAGPIERATHLLPQIIKPRIFDYQKAIAGTRQILWGIFKKVVIADNCAPFVNDIFSTYQTQPGSILILGLVLFAFQIYGDFSGYSDVALGVSRLLGFELLKNFNFPYFSKSISELWRKWHMSLSTWTNDYIFLPIIKTKTKWGRWGIIYGLVCTFTILGLWHGANWTFVAFGLYNGLIVAFEYFFQKQIRQKNKFIASPYITGFTGWAATFGLWLGGMLLFRSKSLSQAAGFIANIFQGPFFPPSLSVFLGYKYVFIFIAFLMVIEWLNRNNDFGFDIIWIKNPVIRWALYYVILLIILRYPGTHQDFIYFQF